MTASMHALDGQGRRGNAGSQAPVRLAVVDSDSGFLQVLTKRLEGAGWQYRILASPVPLDAMVSLRLNAVVVDLAVLGPHGWSYLERLCERLPQLGVIVCTGQSSVAQRVRGLRMGADDWVTKPCHPEELIARVEAVVRRRKRAEARGDARPVVVGEVEIRADQFQAFVDGRSVELTRREFELIELLAAAEGQVLQREEIYERVWGYAMAHGDRSVDVFVRKLRQKLERASPGWRYIHTHFGIGYRFAGEPVLTGAPAAVAAGVGAAPDARRRENGLAGAEDAAPAGARARAVAHVDAVPPVAGTDAVAPVAGTDAVPPVGGTDAVAPVAADAVAA